MSWDVIVLRFSRPFEAVDEIPKTEQTLALGPVDAVHRAISLVFPGTSWSDPAWGTWESDFGSIEFNVGREDPVGSVMLHVRASAEVVPGIVELCRRNGWQAIDCSMGTFLEKSADPAAGLEGWRAYRDRVIGDRDDT